MKFTPVEGKITLKLAARDNQAILSVVDTGIGIPPEDLPHLFEKLHRGRNASLYPGSGLGLSIVKALVEAQGVGSSEPGTSSWLFGDLPPIGP